jgi:hypothetical protein
VESPSKGSIPHRIYFAAASLAYLAIFVLMTGVHFVARPEGDQMVVQLGDLADKSTLYQTGYVLATLLPLAGLLLTAGVGLLIRPQYWAPSGRSERLLGLIGSLFVLAYAGLSGFAYVSQWTILPRRLADNFQDAERWYYSFDAVDSLPLSLDLLAYALFGVGAVLIAARLLYERSPLNWASWALAACGLANIAAWLLHVADVGAAETASLVGIALTIPFALGIFLFSQQGAEEVVSEDALPLAGDDEEETAAAADL